MRSSSRMPPSFLLLLERAPKPDAKITQTFSLSLSRSSLGSKAKAVREERVVIFFCADGLKFCFFFKKKQRLFFSFFFRGKFSLAFFSQREQPINFSSAFFFKHRFTLTHAAAFQQNTVRFLRARKRDKERN